MYNAYNSHNKGTSAYTYMCIYVAMSIYVGMCIQKTMHRTIIHQINELCIYIYLSFIIFKQNMKLHNKRKTLFGVAVIVVVVILLSNIDSLSIKKRGIKQWISE